MNKTKLILLSLFFLLILVSTLALTTIKEPILKDVVLHPENYDRLPNDLTPYKCPDGSYDLQTASELIKKGLSPSAKYSPSKDSLRCD